VNKILTSVQASAGSSLYDTAGMDRYGGGEVAGAAAVLEATQLCNTRQLRDMLACLGGIGVLLPFIAQVQKSHAIQNLEHAVLTVWRLVASITAQHVLTGFGNVPMRYLLSGSELGAQSLRSLTRVLQRRPESFLSRS